MRGLAEAGEIELDPADVAELDQAEMESEPMYGWKTIARVDDERVARGMAAIVGMGVGHDRGFTGRAIAVDEFRAESGEVAVERAERYRERPEVEHGAMLEAIVRAVLEGARAS
jgi:hypothetical protein